MEFDPNKTPAYLAGIIDKLVKEQARNTIEKNVAADRKVARYARVADGGACDFCKMLTSRGYVYKDEGSAGEKEKYHPFCNCQIAVSFVAPNGKKRGKIQAKKDEEGIQALQDAVADLKESKFKDYSEVSEEPAGLLTAAERIYIPTVTRKWSSFPMDESEVEGILNAAEEIGAIKYKKNRGSEDMVRDLFAHAALYRDGWEYDVVQEIEGQKNIDILDRDGNWWEIKSPISKADGKSPLRFVEQNLKEAIAQFDGKPGVDVSQTRVVFNNRFTGASDESVVEEIRRRMKQQRFSSIIEVIVVKKDGTLAHLSE